MAEDYLDLLEKYRELKEKAISEKENIAGSRTYSSSGRVEPTEEDIELSKSARKTRANLDYVMSDIQKERWYGSKEEREAQKEAWEGMTADERNKGEGAFSRALNLASTPLYATVGLAESLTGEATESGVLENIKSNIKEREAFGDLLAKKGAPTWLQFGAGLALDIALDPLNWATLGTGATIPRVLAGMRQGAKLRGASGAARGAAKALKSRGAEIAESAVKTAEYVPYAGGYLREANKAKKFRDFLGKQSEDWYNFAKEADQDIIKAFPMSRATSKMSEGIAKLFSPNAKRQIKASLGYESRKPLLNMMKQEDLVRGVEESDVLTELDKYTSGANKVHPDNPFAAFVSRDVKNPADSLRGEALKASDIITSRGDRFRSGTSAEMRERLASEARRNQDTAQVIERLLEIAEEKTGVDIVDDVFEKLGNWAKTKKGYETLEKGLKAYEKFIYHFKASKVPLSPSAWTNALIGNAVMTKMLGLDLKADLAKDVAESFKMVNGLRVDPNFIRKFIDDPEVADWIGKYPRAFAIAFGVDPKALTNREVLLAKLSEYGGTGKSKAKLMEYLDKADSEIREITRPYAVGKKVSESLGGNGMNLPVSMRGTFSADAMAGLKGVEDNLLSSFATSEHESLRRLHRWYSDIYLKKPMELYESLDQSYKLGMFTHLTNNGITRKEMRHLSGTLGDLVENKDFVKVEGKDLYRLKPARAAEVTQELYMNYGAMPGIVRFLRKAPIIGIPFGSFMYGMATKTAKTAAKNASFFSKMNSLQKEISGQQDPVERKHLQSMYASYLNQPGMMRLPMFRDNPAFLRVEQMLPYYSLNIFQPSQRDLNNPYARAVTELTDKFGLASTPEGQLMLNYLILPLILNDEEVPQGLFGNKLYPQDATGAEKALSATRDLAEAATPQIIGPLGTLQGWANRKAAPIPGEDSWTDYLTTEEYFPSFRYKQFARSTRGQSAVGVKSSTEDAPAKWLKTFGSWLGIPVYTTKIYSEEDYK